MPYAIIPPGYRAVLLGAAITIDGLGTYAPLEEGQPEGALMLARLDFEDEPSGESLLQFNDACLAQGVLPWPGNAYVAFFDPNGAPSIYIAWQKGIAWMPIIIGILLTLVLPPLLMAGIWLILPEALRSLLQAAFMAGIMFLVLFVMMKMMRPLMVPEKAPKKPEEIEK